jgi:hypothetical protein
MHDCAVYRSFVALRSEETRDEDPIHTKMAREPSENEQRLERRKKEMETAQEQGDARKIQKLRDEMIVIKRLIKKENEQILPHRS